MNKKTEKNKHAVALSKLGASKGGRARVAKLSKEELSKANSHAVKARWAKYKKNKK